MKMSLIPVEEIKGMHITYFDKACELELIGEW